MATEIKDLADHAAVTGSFLAVQDAGGTGGKETIADVLALYTGSASVVTVGTVTAGTWSATAVGATKGGTSQTTYALGDVLYCSATNTLSKLAGNTTTTRKFLQQTGDGAASAAPAWDTVTKTDVGLANVENTALSTWAGSANIVTVGTIATGAWNATAIAIVKGGTGATTASAAFDALSPMTVLGDVVYGGASGTGTRLAGNTTTTKKFLRQTGDGVNSAAPAWDTVVAGDIASGTIVHERGGLEADVSAYAGLVQISAGATSAVSASAASKLLGRGSAGGAGLFGEVSLGSGLTMTGTTLSASASAPALDDVTDVTITAVADNEVLAYDSGSTSWINQTASEAGLAASGANTDITSVYLNNTGLKIKDTNASHGLIIAPGSDLTADHTLTITTGDADRTLTLNGAATISGTNTGDQTITLTGDVTGSGTGSFATTIAADAVTYAKMQNVSATDKLLGRSSLGAGDVEEIACTAAGRAILDDADAAAQRTTLGLGNVENTALSTWAGSANIVTVGTITTGTWNATTLAITKGGTGATTATAAFDVLSPMTALGDVVYGGTSGTGTRLAGNTTTTKKFLRQTGDGAASAAPVWDTVVAGDLASGTIVHERGGLEADVSAYDGLVKITGGATSAVAQTTFVHADGSVNVTGEQQFQKAVNHHQLEANTPSGTTQTIDWRNGCMQTLTLSSASGDVTVTFTAPTGSAAHLTLKVVQGGTARDVTWPAAVKWDAGDGEPTWNADTSKTRIVVFVYDGTNYYAAATPTYT